MGLGQPNGGVESPEESRAVLFQQFPPFRVTADHLRTACNMSSVVRHIAEQGKAQQQQEKHLVGSVKASVRVL